MGTNSARPDALDHFADRSRAADNGLRSHDGLLRSAYASFRAGTQWGTLEADSLLQGLHDFIHYNDVDAQWVQRIAAAFRHADAGNGSLPHLPDAAIAGSLAAAGLDGRRRSVAFDDPRSYGMPPTTGYANDPVNTATGNFVELESDLRFTGLARDLTVARVYNSRSDRAGAFGLGWSSWADARLREGPDGAEYEGPDGQRALFGRGEDRYDRVVGVNALVEPLRDGLVLRWFDGRRWEFDGAGFPLRCEAGPGTGIRFRHDDGRLVELAHAGGRRVRVDWDGARISALHASDGRRAEYRYDAAQNLEQADGVAGPRRYEVDDGGRVVGVTDADDVAEVRNRYDDDGCVRAQLSPFGRLTFFSYLPGLVTVTADEQDGPSNVYVHDEQGRLEAIVDGAGQRLEITYDRWGNPATVKERNGAVTRQEWDARGKLLRRVLPGGAEFRFTHDEAGRVVEVATGGAAIRHEYAGDERSPVQITDAEGGVARLDVRDGLVHGIVDPDGVQLRFEFDGDGNIVASIDADGNVARLERDATGLVTAAVTPLGRRTVFVHDAQERPVQRREPGGAVWRYEYSAAGRLVGAVDPTGAREQIAYGEHGAAAATVDPLGRLTAHSYDVFGNRVAVVAPGGATWQFAYDALCRLTSIANPSGAAWRREYDVNGNLTGSIDPVGTRYSATVDGAGRVTALDDGETSAAFDFDALGRCLAQLRPDGTAARAGYDRMGRRTSIEDPAGGTTTIEYTPGGRVRRVVAPSGSADVYEYDRCGRTAARTDGAGRRWEFRYDADGALVETIHPGGESERVAYDDAGRPVAWTAPGRGPRSYEYDAAGRIIAITDRTSGTRRFEYDPAGQLVVAVDANGGRTRYAYDDGGRLLAVIDPLGGRVTRTYDAAGRPASETDQLGRTTTWRHDAAGRLVERIDGAGRRRLWTYDESGRVRSFGAAGEEPVTIARDALGREIAIEEPGSFSHTLSWDRAGRLAERRRGELALRWGYDEDGRRAFVGYPDGSETAYAYDGGGLLATLRHPATGAIELERDAGGRLVGARGAGMDARWEYDAGGELVGYTFDAADMRRAAKLTRDPVGRVVAAVVDGVQQRFAYDPAGQLVQAGELSLEYDAGGRLVGERSGSSSVAYEHDAAGQIVARRTGDGAGTRYEYDGSGRRVRQHGDGVERMYRWDSVGRLVAIDDGARVTRTAVDALGELAEVDGTPLLWDTADRLSPPAWLDGRAIVGHGAPWATAAGDDADWLAPDWQGTIGAPRDPFGAPAGADLQLGYRGELEFAGETWMRARVYEPATRAFLQPDPLPALPGTAYAANPYQFAANNPVGLADPLGLRPVTDQELRDIRDGMGHNILHRAADAIADNADTIAAVALIAGGVALMATGVGGAPGVALMMGGSGLLSAGASVGIQKLTTGRVNYAEAGIQGLIGVGAGGLGVGAGALVQGTTKAAAIGRGALAGGVESVTGGMANRGLHGDDPFDPRAMGADLLLGGGTGGVGGSLGAPVRGSEDYVNLASAQRTQHILYGDATGGGHLHPGLPGKTPFPPDWSGDKIMHAASDIATDPTLQAVQQGNREVIHGVRDGVPIKVVTQGGSDIVTAHPTAGIRNPP